MTRSVAVSFVRLWVLAVLLFSALALLAAADRAAAEEGGIEDNPPLIMGGAVSPGSLSYEGGNVQLSADVVDDVGVSMVYAQIYSSDGLVESQQLFLGNENTYFGTFQAPPNPADTPVIYGVEIQAWDTNGAYVASLVAGFEVEGRPQFDEFPYVSEAQLLPSFLPAAGGPVTISADAADNRGLSAVFATVVALPGGKSTEVPLNPVSSSRFEGTFTAPPNPGPLGAEYLVEVIAQDDIGQETRVSAGTITVDAPPPQPSGTLALTPESIDFGRVKLGKSSRGFVVLRNVSSRRSVPIEGVVMTGSGPFSLVGAPSEGVGFRLRAGDSKRFRVQFSPEQIGPQSGWVAVVRDDGGQPELAAALSGEGAPPWHPRPRHRWR